MKRQRQRLISILSVLAFLIAHTPGSAIVLHGSWRTAPACPHADCSSARPKVVEHHCDCCHEDDGLDQQTAQTDPPRPLETPRCPTCPTCPDAPSCPHGCCWCSVAKVPCFLASLAPSTDLLPNLGARLVETSLLLPPAHCTELIRPPRS